MSTGPSIMPPRIVRGPKVLLVCAGLVVGLAGFAGWYMIREKPVAGAYIDVLALDEEYAVAIREETTSGRSFVELIGLQERLRWQALVPHYEVSDGGIGIAASDHAVTVRFARDGRTQLFGFAARSAQKLGTVILGDQLAKEPDGHRAPGIASLSGGTQSFEILEPDAGPTRVYALSLDDGTVMWRGDLPRGGIESTWLTGTQLVIEQPGEVTVLDRDSGAAATHPAEEVCVVPGEGDRADAVLIDQGRLCGRHDGAIWTVADAGAGTVVAAVGAAQVGISISGGHASPGAQRVAAPLSLPFAGELAAVVPLQIGDRLVGVDLVGRAIAWQSAAAPSLRDAIMIDAGAATLVRAGDLLISIDPASGVAHAVRVPGARPLRAHHVAGGAVWIVGDRGLVVLDAVTLARRGTWASTPVVEAADDQLSSLGLRTSR